MSASDPVTATVNALVADVLAHAGRCLAVSSWPAPSPPVGSPDVPAIEVQHDGDSAEPAVFAFATVVVDDGPCQTPLEIRRSDVDDDSVAVGDEVGLELPIGQVAALAWALLSVQIERDNDDVFVPLPAPLWQTLRDSGRIDAVLHALAALMERFAAPTTPALSHLTRLASLDERRCRAALRVTDDGPGCLLVLAVDDDSARVVVVKGTADRDAVRTLGRAVPPPPPASATALWHHLARPTTWGPPVQAGPFRAGVTGVDVDGQDVVVTLRLALLEGDGDCDRAEDAREVDAREARCTLPAPPLLLQAAIDDDGLARATASASRFLRRALEAAAALRLAPERVLHGSAWARVVARAAGGVALEPRSSTALDVSEMDDEGRVSVDIGEARLVLSPADDALLVPVPAHRTGVPVGASQWPKDASGEVLRPAYQEGRTLDGDDEAARAVCLALAGALSGGEADLELVLVDNDGTERELTLSTWLRGLADLPSAGRLPPHASARDAFSDVADALLDER